MLGYLIFGFFVFSIIILIVHLALEDRRRTNIERDYGASEIGSALLNREITQGMTTWQVLEAWGEPDAKETAVARAKAKEVWLYGRNGKGVANRVYFEDGVVVGWKQRK